MRPRRAAPNTRYTRPTVIAAPATPHPTRRYGDLSQAEMVEIIAVAARVWPHPDSRREGRARGLRKLGAYLLQYPGVTWQQRWDGCPLNSETMVAGDVSSGSLCARSEFHQAVEALFALQIIRPTLVVMRNNRSRTFCQHVISAANDPALNAVIAAIDALDTCALHKRWAIFDVCAALITQGIPIADLTPEAFLYYTRLTRDTVPRGKSSMGKYVGTLAWKTLHSCGHFPAGAPPTLRAALRAPQLSITEIVDQYPVTNPAVRQMFIDYLTRRGAEVDYSSLARMGQVLVKLFWVAIEHINPDQADLRLSAEVYTQWRATISVCEDGSPRLDQRAVLTWVRALYADIHTWAVHEPEHWAQWSVPCPVPRSDMRALSNHLPRRRERTHATIRVLQPLLPLLVEHVTTRYEQLDELNRRGAAAGDGEQFIANGTTYTRVYTRNDRTLIAEGRTPRVRVYNHTTCAKFDVTRLEDAAFWSWAIVETLRLSGLRIEELTELSQLSVRQYQRPNGEVIALLVVAPSKTDRERVIPMSAELFHVIACVIRRITAGRTSVPLATRYDDCERITTDPQPFLFQRHIGNRVEVMSTGAIGISLRSLCADIARTDKRFAGIHFRPHDFRRLFATNLVNAGLPIHIGAALLGHLDLQTTRGYVAVFNEDVIRHYQAHLQRRRATRPTSEYTPVSDDEWAEFDAHFDKRKVELGGCGRPYATPCTHEHACIRCPMLHIDPKMLTRLDEIETDLLARRDHAHTEGWLGEIDGIDLTLSYLRTKRDELHHRLRRTTNLGVPAMPHGPAGLS
ncbi:tyrosine-type recombinase/integrase [Gordonia jinhuaensis]|nr:site-specific integrase [Gordonia jinhuaensis]